MRVTSLASCSSGNALLVEAGPRGRTKILVDVGLTAHVLIERLRRVGIQPTQLQGVLVTHEHGDHIAGLPVLLKRYAVPVMTAPETFAAIEQSFASGNWQTDSGPLNAPETDMEIGAAAAIRLANAAPAASSAQARREEEEQLFKPLTVGSRSMIGDIEVISFPVSHDAEAPCGYLLTAGGCRICIVTDTGEVTAAMLEKMHAADLLILESNHDRERLLRGPYPPHLKQRILSPTGHLSNDQAADAVLHTWRTDSVRWLWLSHLSRTNNTPKLALTSMVNRLQAANANLSQIHISVLPPGMGGVWDSTQLWHSPSLWEMQR